MALVKGGRSLLIYGVSGSYKTTQAGMFAKFIYEHTGKRTRLITADGGGYQPLEPYIDAGIIDPPFNLQTYVEPTAAMDFLCEGRWPAADPKKPGTWLPAKNWPVTDFEKENIGAYILEGMYSWSSLMMNKSILPRGPKLGEGASYTFIEGGKTYHGPNKSYYGFIQRRMETLILEFNKLPLERVLWTSLEVSVDDGLEESKIIGPALIGKASTKYIPQWVGECLHFDRFVQEEREIPGEKSKIKHKIYGTRVYFVPHPDPINGRMHECKPRIPSDQWHKLIEKYPGGFFVAKEDSGLDEYLHFEETLREQATEKLSDWKASVDAKRKANSTTSPAPVDKK